MPTSQSETRKKWHKRKKNGQIKFVFQNKNILNENRSSFNYLKTHSQTYGQSRIQ